MKHKLLFLCALFTGAGFSPLPVSASGAAEKSIESTIPTAQAMRTLGIRYRLGGKSPDTGFDCSGLVVHVFEQAWGVTLPRNVQAQGKVGVPIAMAKLEPGDLVFYNTRNQPYSHVGIYLGDGRFIHAPRPGQLVRVESLQSPYWKARFSGARRMMLPSKMITILIDGVNESYYH
jgi:cell wall-associated NlpC family hydrolase